MKNKLIITLVLSSLLFSCNPNNDSSFNAYNTESSLSGFLSGGNAAAISDHKTVEESSLDSSNQTSDEECAVWGVDDTIIKGFLLQHTYDMSETPTLTVSYARRTVGEYYLAIFEGRSFYGGVPLCSDYFSEDDLERAYGENLYNYPRPLVLKTFTMDFDFRILKGLNSNYFSLTVAGETDLEKHYGVFYAFSFYFDEDDKITIYRD